MKLLIATTNAGKVREFREMLGAGRFEWCDLKGLTGVPEVEETGRTFRENACLKASAYAKFAGCWALADDSGLEVDALGGKPGVHSARWAQMHDQGEGDANNNVLLLRQIEAVPDAARAARFVCVLALSDEAGNIVLTARDTVEGRLLRAACGTNGFGYDPLFLIDALGKTTAELEPDEKHAVSHRGNAMRRLKAMLPDVSTSVGTVAVL